MVIYIPNSTWCGYSDAWFSDLQYFPLQKIRLAEIQKSEILARPPCPMWNSDTAPNPPIGIFCGWALFKKRDTREPTPRSSAFIIHIFSSFTIFSTDVKVSDLNVTIRISIKMGHFTLPYIQNLLSVDVCLNNSLFLSQMAASTAPFLVVVFMQGTLMQYHGS